MKPNTMLAALRLALLALGILGLVLTLGFVTFQGWATALIPWDLDQMAAIFMASIYAAAAVPILWIARTREYAAMTGGGFDFGLTFAGFAAFAFQAYLKNPRLALLLFGLFCAAGVIVCIGLVYLGLRQSFSDRRQTPLLVRASFAAFALVLTFTGALLVLNRPGVFPWSITPQQSVLYGWIFLGAATYFAYGLLRPVWVNAQGQLLGFLAYDLILIVPLLSLFLGNTPILLPNLVLYITIVTYSGILTLWYLLVGRTTRISFKPAQA